jgi:hypothetical protein
LKQHNAAAALFPASLLNLHTDTLLRKPAPAFALPKETKKQLLFAKEKT